MSLKAVTFTDGSAFFEEVDKKYIAHEKGLFIMSPSGAGKTYFCKQQAEPHWIDGDDLWIESGAQPPIEDAWWDQGFEVIEQVEQRCDVITAQAVDRGFWILGSVNYSYKPNAIVIPPWDTLMAQITQRQQDGYDGGLTDAHKDQIISHIGIINQWYLKYGVPKFQSVQEAVSALTS